MVPLNLLHLKNIRKISVMSTSNNGANYSLAPFFFLFIFFVSAFGSPIQQISTKRPDPLRHLSYYNGSFNVTDKHYWTSAAFTGVHGYAMAGIWMSCGLCFGSFLAGKTICGGSSTPTDHLARHYFLLFSLVLLFTFLSMVASCCVLAANQISYERMKRLKNTIVNAGNDARETIYNLNKAMTRIQYLLLPYDIRTTNQLNGTTHLLRRESLALHAYIQKNEKSIDMGIQSLYVSHLTVAVLNIVLLVTALVLFLWHWHPGIIIIFFLCWILTTLFWFLTGADFFLNSVTEDTCYAFQDFVQNPEDNDFSSMLPCMNATASDKILSGIGFAIHNFIIQVNSKITEVCQSLGLNEKKDEWFPFATICDPFSKPPNYAFDLRDCADNSIHIGDLPKLLAEFTCYKGKSSQGCTESGKFLSEEDFDKATAYSYSIQTMVDMFPDLSSLTRCNVVKDTLTNIVLHQCKPFQSSIRFLWISMLCLSIFMVFLVLIWVVKVYQERGASFSRFSIFPNPREGSQVDVDQA